MCHSLVLVFRQQGEESLGKPRQVPGSDARLVGIGIAPVPIDRAEDGRWVISIQKRTGAIVDGLSCNRHVVGVHHAMNEADQQPLRDQRGLTLNYKIEKSSVAMLVL